MLPTAFFVLVIEFSEILAQEKEMATKPKVLVFDLDYTLWPFWVDTHVNPPFRKTSNGSIVDSYGSVVTHYPEVPDVLSDLHKQGYVMAVASRTGEIVGALQLLDLFEWKKFFSNEQIYPSAKTTHLTKIKNALGVEFRDIIFFDDENRNIRDVSSIGVFSILVENGVTKKVVDDALRQFSKQRS